MFDSRKELLDRIRLGESTFLELQEVRFGKGEVIEPRDSDLADELAALANSYGGVCALGVSAHPPRIVGIPPHHLNQLDAADISGPLDRQVEEACRFVAKNMKVAAFKSLGRVDLKPLRQSPDLEAARASGMPVPRSDHNSAELL